MSSESQSQSGEAVEGHRILIVESEVETADRLAQLMGELGHVVQLAADAKSALYELHDFEPHLVLLGTYLADMPGYELSAILKGAPQYSYKFRHVVVLFVADRGKLLKHRFVGAPDVPIAQYIFKPLNDNEVREKVTRALRHGIN
jgi:DNA-binding response OmpR family regulator